MRSNGTTTNYQYGLDRLSATTNGTRSWFGNDALGSARYRLTNRIPERASSYHPWGDLYNGYRPLPFGFIGELQYGGAVMVHFPTTHTIAQL